MIRRRLTVAPDGKCPGLTCILLSNFMGFDILCSN